MCIIFPYGYVYYVVAEYLIGNPLHWLTISYSDRNCFKLIILTIRNLFKGDGYKYSYFILVIWQTKSKNQSEVTEHEHEHEQEADLFYKFSFWIG